MAHIICTLFKFENPHKGISIYGNRLFGTVKSNFGKSLAVWTLHYDGFCSRQKMRKKWPKILVKLGFWTDPDPKNRNFLKFFKWYQITVLTCIKTLFQGFYKVPDRYDSGKERMWKKFGEIEISEILVIFEVPDRPRPQKSEFSEVLEMISDNGFIVHKDLISQFE